MKNCFVIEFPLEEKYFVSLRLATAGICDVAELDVEKSEDFKLCVAEACLSLMRAGFSAARVQLSGEDGMQALISGVGDVAKTPKLSAEGEQFTLSLLAELVDELNIERKGDLICCLQMKAKA